MLAPEFLPVWGGVGTYIVELVKHMPSSVEIHVVTPFRERIGQNKVSSNEYDFSSYFGDNVHIHFISRASDTFFYNAFFQYAVARYVPKLVKEEKIDLIHSHTAHMPDLLLSSKNLNVPIVTTIHTTIKGQRQGTKSSGVNFSELEFSEKMTFLTYPFLSFVEDFYFKKSRCYITVSYWMRDQLLKYYSRLAKQKIYVIHNAVDTKTFSPSTGSIDKIFNEKDVILFTGRFTAAKGINILIDAIPEVIKNHRDVHFLFIGPGNPLPYAKRLEKKSVSKLNYSFLGYLKHRETLVSYYRSSDIFVIPSFYENLPIRLLEAMACCVPVVATKICAIPEVIENGVEGILIPPGSVNDLANTILYLIENPDLRRIMGRKARKKVEDNFSWAVAIRKTLNVYEHVLSEGI